jgi:hypothetical protein
MAPTELLAEQHYATLCEVAEQLPLALRPRVALVTNSLKPKVGGAALGGGGLGGRCNLPCTGIDPLRRCAARTPHACAGPCQLRGQTAGPDGAAPPRTPHLGRGADRCRPLHSPPPLRSGGT